jgi:5-formyltetrahydrofolate cyclo-ligase
MIDMGDLPPLDLIHELRNIAQKVKRKSNPKVFQELSDLVAILVAASVRETASMVNELFIRELISQLDDNLTDLLKDASYEDGADDA